MCNEPMRELSNPGASGSVFYVSDNDDFLVKTVQHSEADFLQKLLPGYFMVSSLKLYSWKIYGTCAYFGRFYVVSLCFRI